jgi:hypothetical protein
LVEIGFPALGWRNRPESKPFHALKSYLCTLEKGIAWRIRERLHDLAEFDLQLSQIASTVLDEQSLDII